MIESKVDMNRLFADNRAAEGTWTVLGTHHNSPYLNARDALAAGQPEVRRYRGRYIVNDERVGQRRWRSRR